MSIYENGKLTFLHLSDIHFSRKSGDSLDLDRDLRDQLLNDLKEYMLPKITSFTGLLISGDIAYSGNQKEYDIAVNWIEDICKVANCAPHQVWVVPGNHDVDRTSIKCSKIINDIHKRVRSTETHCIDEEIISTLRDDSYGKVLLQPLTCYTKFAARYECQISVDRPYWQSRPLKMNDGSELCFRGLTSTIISDEYDDNEKYKLVLGKNQVQMNEVPGRIYITLCHHPLDWLKDADNVSPYILSRSRVAIFGHKHKFQIHKQVHDEGSTVIINSGALHPERKDWLQPTYNAISLHITGVGTGRKLIIRVYTRRWDGDTTRFKTDRPSGETEYREFNLDLPNWLIKHKAQEGQDMSKTCEQAQQEPNGCVSKGINDAAITVREFTYKFLSLPYHEIMAVGNSMGLVEDEDEGVQVFVLTQRFTDRAINRNMMNDLIETVMSKYTGIKGRN